MEMTGTLRITWSNAARAPVAFAWEGGDVVGISRELLDDAVPPLVTYATFPDRIGCRFCVGPYLLEVVAVAADRILARRI